VISTNGDCKHRPLRRNQRLDQGPQTRLRPAPSDRPGSPTKMRDTLLAKCNSRSG
jgi:hypothetical protein